MLALIVAAIEIGLGLGKLGFVADLLSKEVQVGYMIGLGITIIVGQLPKLFGFSTDANGFIDEVRAFFDGLDARNRDTLIVGCASLAVLLILPRFTRRLPAVLITVILATLAVSLFDLKSHGVATVGSLPQGLPRPQIPTVNLTDFGRCSPPLSASRSCRSPTRSRRRRALPPVAVKQIPAEFAQFPAILVDAVSRPAASALIRNIHREIRVIEPADRYCAGGRGTQDAGGPGGATSRGLTGSNT